MSGVSGRTLRTMRRLSDRWRNRTGLAPFPAVRARLPLGLPGGLRP